MAGRQGPSAVRSHFGSRSVLTHCASIRAPNGAMVSALHTDSDYLRYIELVQGQLPEAGWTEHRKLLTIWLVANRWATNQINGLQDAWGQASGYFWVFGGSLADLLDPAVRLCPVEPEGLREPGLAKNRPSVDPTHSGQTAFK